LRQLVRIHARFVFHTRRRKGERDRQTISRTKTDIKDSRRPINQFEMETQGEATFLLPQRHFAIILHSSPGGSVGSRSHGNPLERGRRSTVDSRGYVRAHCFHFPVIECVCRCVREYEEDTERAQEQRTGRTRQSNETLTVTPKARMMGSLPV
jgi:hypothetical protein